MDKAVEAEFLQRCPGGLEAVKGHLSPASTQGQGPRVSSQASRFEPCVCTLQTFQRNIDSLSH